MTYKDLWVMLILGEIALAAQIITGSYLAIVVLCCCYTFSLYVTHKEEHTAK